jgi:hypothetical protein
VGTQNDSIEDHAVSGDAAALIAPRPQVDDEHARLSARRAFGAFSGSSTSLWSLKRRPDENNAHREGQQAGLPASLMVHLSRPIFRTKSFHESPV